jgi:proteasomal ATPase-associated factor 1
MLPYLKIQHDWELGDKFWGHYKTLEKEEDLTLTRSTENRFKIEKDGISTTFIHPSKTVNIPKSESFDIQDNIGLLGGPYGALKLIDVNDGAVTKELKGHVGDINDCLFLPSKQVAMSASSDTSIKIWRIEDGLCALTLKGHSGGVLSLSIIDRGKEFLSTSRDGVMKLWDCSQGKSISDLVVEKSSMNGCHIEDKIAVCVSENGALNLVDWANGKVIYKYTHKNPLNCCHISNGIVQAGSARGELITFDVKAPEKATILHRVSPNAVLRIRSPMWTCHQDGSVLNWDTDKPNIQIDLTGSNFDPVYDYRMDGSTIYTICRDGKLRKYLIG